MLDGGRLSPPVLRAEFITDGYPHGSVDEQITRDARQSLLEIICRYRKRERCADPCILIGCV